MRSSILLPYESQSIRNFPLTLHIDIDKRLRFYLARVIQSENNILNINRLINEVVYIYIYILILLIYR